MYYETCHICVTYCCIHEAQIVNTLFALVRLLVTVTDCLA